LPKDVRVDEVPIPSIEDLGIARNPRLVPAGERAARGRLKRFLDDHAGEYWTARDRLDLPGTSRLSQDLKFGLLSPRTVWHAAETALSRHAARSLAVFQNELVWRDFAYSTLWDRPNVLNEPFRPEFRGFPWRKDERGWSAWALGRTGYPVVDAAARQLLSEGFVHNRARMIAGSFLTKHLLIDYRRGEAHYLKWLTDGDWASNNLGWQWVAGSGCDAQPYFRVFNPVTQGKKFDPEGNYVRRWVPELARVPAEFIHEPWKAPPPALASAGVELGRDYPRPIVDHDEARGRFLAVASSYLKRAG
jgi:deoxyribodipyrimidine photo-lyase